MGIIFTVLGTIFTLVSIIMVIPSNSGNKGTKMKGTVLSCLEETPELENLIEFATNIDIDKTKFQYQVKVECIENGQRVEKVISSDKKRQIGDNITFYIKNGEDLKIKDKKVTGSTFGGIVGILLGLGFIVVGILYIIGVIK